MYKYFRQFSPANFRRIVPTRLVDCGWVIVDCDWMVGCLCWLVIWLWLVGLVDGSAEVALQPRTQVAGRGEGQQSMLLVHQVAGEARVHILLDAFHLTPVMQRMRVRGVYGDTGHTTA